MGRAEISPNSGALAACRRSEGVFNKPNLQGTVGQDDAVLH
jgi:hypothetical protein